MKCIISHYDCLTVGTTISVDDLRGLSNPTTVDGPVKNTDNAKCTELIVEYIKVSGSTAEEPQSAFLVHDVDLDIQPFVFCEGPPAVIQVPVEGLEPPPAFMKVTSLPHRDYDGLWESLMFDRPLPDQLLRFSTQTLRMTANKQLSSHIICINKLILLHGSSGTGKTSLIRAVSQRLSIRLKRKYSQTLLVEVGTRALFSRWFGESANLVCSCFDGIQQLAKDPDVLVCVLIDEVESIAGSRERSYQSSEVVDSVRATNQLLVALDSLSGTKNVIVFATSNLQSVMVECPSELMVTC